MSLRHMRFRCKWCGRLISGCPPTCLGVIHRTEEVECCVFCAHRPEEELRLTESYPDDPEVTQSLLGLILEDPPTLETVAAWTPGQRRAAEEWAGREYIHACVEETPVERVKRPDFIEEVA
jgi:hypothetical protein